MFNFHEGREWFLCQDKWNLLLEIIEVEMKIIIKKHEEALDRESVKVAQGNSWKETAFIQKIYEQMGT